MVLSGLIVVFGADAVALAVSLFDILSDVSASFGSVTLSFIASFSSSVGDAFSGALSWSGAELSIDALDFFVAFALSDVSPFCSSLATNLLVSCDEMGKHNYDVVMKAIHYLADEGIKVNMRVNFDWENIDRLSMFFREIKAEFGNNDNISLYIAPLFQVQHTDSITDLYRRMFELEDEMKSLGLTKSARDHETVRIRVNYCMADGMDNCIVITPDGVFNNCEHLPESQTWGNIFDGVTDKAKLDELKKPVPIHKMCAKCSFLPQCTPFYKNGCPGWFEKCCEYHCIKTEHELHNLLQGHSTGSIEDDEEDQDV